MKIMNMFSNPVFVDFLNLDNNTLETYCKEKCNNSSIHEHRGYAQSDILNSKDIELQELVSCVQDRMNLLHLKIGLSKKYRSEIYQVWANVDNNSVIGVPHVHPAAAFSGVYYVKGNPDSSCLQFINPNSAQPGVILPEYIDNLNEFTAGVFNFRPIPGKLIIFPAWLYHYVSSGIENQERISIAFNFKIAPMVEW